MSTPILTAKRLGKTFGGRPASVLGPEAPAVRALDGVDLEACAGKTLGIVGESGSGKTTLARLLLLLDKPSEGEILFDGLSVAGIAGERRRDFRRRIQPVFQNPYSSLDPRMRVGEIVGEPMGVAGVAAAERRERIAGALVKVSLSPDDAKRFPAEFSGGQRQRIAIARAIASRPDLIILDEPVSSQDISVRAQILNLLKDLQDETGVGYILITHDLSTLRFMCDEVMVMHRGKVVERGAPARICDQPENAYTRELVSSVLTLDALDLAARS
jgi:ABC-type microcin C transport system duplicated ATPase subunit YejF